MRGLHVALGPLADVIQLGTRPEHFVAKAIGLGAQVPFGPMLAIAGAIYFLFLRGFVTTWFAQFGELF